MQPWFRALLAARAYRTRVSPVFSSPRRSPDEFWTIPAFPFSATTKYSQHHKEGAVYSWFTGRLRRKARAQHHLRVLKEWQAGQEKAGMADDFSHEGTHLSLADDRLAATAAGAWQAAHQIKPRKDTP